MSIAQPTLATYAVCYLDMLGYEDLVKRTVEKPDLIIKIESVFKTALPLVRGGKIPTPKLYDSLLLL